MALKTYPPVYDLPRSYNEQLGRIIVRWGYLEHHAQDIVYWLLGVSPKAGRVAVNEPRLADRIDMIAELAHLYAIKTTPKQVKSLRDKAEDYKFFRDLYAHGLWLYDKKQDRFLVQMTRGAKPNKPPHATKYEWNRRIRPAGLPTHDAELEIFVADLDDMRRELELFDQTIRQQKPSRGRRRPR